MLLGSIANIVAKRYDGSHLDNQPDYELYIDIATDPSEIACNVDTNYLMTGIKIEYLDTDSTYKTIFTNNNIIVSNFTIKQSMYFFEAKFNLITTNNIRITFQKTTSNEIIISEIQFYEIISNILNSLDGINWTRLNLPKGIFRANISSIVWDGYQFIVSSYGLNDNNEKSNLQLLCICCLSNETRHCLLIRKGYINTDGCLYTISLESYRFTLQIT
jgi:hypothetical protein